MRIYRPFFNDVKSILRVSSESDLFSNKQRLSARRQSDRIRLNKKKMVKNKDA